MEPGRELDALVAEKVMGFEKNKEVFYWMFGEENYDIFYDKQGKPHTILPNYSTDIEAAWQVLEKLDLHLEGPNPNWIAWAEGATGTIGITAPHAICLAALRTVGHNPSY